MKVKSEIMCKTEMYTQTGYFPR